MAEPRPGSGGPDPPTHFSRAWLSEGNGLLFAPLGVHAAHRCRCCHAVAFTIRAAPRAALPAGEATLRPGPHRPEPQALRDGPRGEPRRWRRRQLQLAPAAGFIFFLFPQRGLFLRALLPVFSGVSRPASPRRLRAPRSQSGDGERVGPAAGIVGPRTQWLPRGKGRGAATFSGRGNCHRDEQQDS